MKFTFKLEKHQVYLNPQTSIARAFVFDLTKKHLREEYIRQVTRRSEYGANINSPQKYLVQFKKGSK